MFYRESISGYVGVVTLCSIARSYLDVVGGYIMFYKENISGYVAVVTCSRGRTYLNVLAWLYVL